MSLSSVGSKPEDGDETVCLRQVEEENGNAANVAPFRTDGAVVARNIAKPANVNGPTRSIGKRVLRSRRESWWGQPHKGVSPQ